MPSSIPPAYLAAASCRVAAAKIPRGGRGTNQFKRKGSSRRSQRRAAKRQESPQEVHDGLIERLARGSGGSPEHAHFAMGKRHGLNLEDVDFGYEGYIHQESHATNIGRRMQTGRGVLSNSDRKKWTLEVGNTHRNLSSWQQAGHPVSMEGYHPRASQALARRIGGRYVPHPDPLVFGSGQIIGGRRITRSDADLFLRHDARERAYVMDALTSERFTDRTTTLHRGTSETFRVGQTVVPGHYVSTSVDPAIARRFNPGTGGSLIIIRARPSTRGLAIADEDSDEKEVILHPTTRMRVVSVRADPTMHGRQIVEMEASGPSRRRRPRRPRPAQSAASRGRRRGRGGGKGSNQFKRKGGSRAPLEGPAAMRQILNAQGPGRFPVTRRDQIASFDYEHGDGAGSINGLARQRHGARTGNTEMFNVGREHRRQSMHDLEYSDTAGVSGLRHGESREHWQERWAQVRTRDLDRLTSRPLGGSVVLHRSVSQHDPILTKHRVADPAFLSTSVDRHFVQSLHPPGTAVGIEIRTHPGQTGYLLHGESSSYDVGEVILPRGTQLRRSGPARIDPTTGQAIYPYETVPPKRSRSVVRPRSTPAERQRQVENTYARGPSSRTPPGERARVAKRIQAARDRLAQSPHRQA